MTEEAEREAAGIERIPVMNKDGTRYMCANKGCKDKSFLPEENHEEENLLNSSASEEVNDLSRFKN